MASNYSSIFDEGFLKNFMRLESSIPNTESRSGRVDQQCNPSSLDIYVSPYFKELMRSPIDMQPFKMGAEQHSSAMNMGSSFLSSSSFVTSCPNNDYNLMTTSNDMAFAHTTRGLSEQEMSVTSMHLSNGLRSEMGFAQTYTVLNESDNGLMPFSNEMPSTSDRVDFKDDITADYLGGITESQWLAWEAQLDEDRKNNWEEVIPLSMERKNLESTSSGMPTPLPVSENIIEISNNIASAFGKKGLLLVPLQEKRPFGSRKLRGSRTVQNFDAKFEISEILANSVQMMDKHRKDGLNVEEHMIKRSPLSLTERLEGWTIEVRKRAAGTYEKFYHHMNSKWVFRSMVEVENFILYEAYPPQPQRRKLKRKIEEVVTSA